MEANQDGAVPVGITLALKAQQRKSSEEKSSDADQLPKRRQRSIKAMRTSRGMKSLQMFVETAMIYVICMVLPSLLGYLYHFAESVQTPSEECSIWDSYIANSPYYQYFSGMVPSAEYLCDSQGSTVWSTVSWAASSVGMCSETKTNLLSDDVATNSDFFTVAICSVVLAVLRIVIVNLTVPIHDSDTLEAMVRCKSIHLLSSDYVVTPVGTPVARRSIRHVSNPDGAIPLPDLGGDDAASDVGLSFENVEDSPVILHSVATGVPATPSVSMITPTQLSFQHEDSKEDYYEPEIEDDMNISKNDLEEQEDDDDDCEEFLNLLNQSRSSTASSSSVSKYAAPRYATALFRLLYSTVAVFIAIVYFRDAEFWPWYVTGHGDTKACWDLSGGLTVGMDSDFDKRNAVLKRYFLWQASYHWHSGAFHVLSLLLLMLHPTKHAARRFLSFQKSTSAYVKRLGQHSLALLLIGITYVFSSLRRLGAIGLFAFDASSWSLHLLQICINAPEHSRWRSRVIVFPVFWFLVIPAFAFGRFFVWPAIWYSATFESNAWLQQLEQMLWPGAGSLLQGILHVLMIILETIALVYFRRLLQHPHVKRILSPEEA